MEKRQIGVITLVCVLGGCLLISATAFGQCNTSLSLEIEVLPNGTYNPQDICESRPLNLKFKYRQCDPTQNRTYSLHSLEYSVFNESEDLPFFKDTLNLTDNTLPYEINESPGIYTPPDSTKIRVEAKLVYTSDKDEIAEAQPVEANLTAPMMADYIIERTYDRMRDGYIRRHILDAGRGLSWLWLKEYEPCLDSKELLRHSRTFKAEGQGQTRVYVPWTRKCTIEGSDDQCGASVVENSDVIYGGSENPLLRGGLAMATFALEYIAYGRPDSLNHAMKLFEYVEKSEWRNPATDELTGFFLRSRWPGNIDWKTHRPYMYASADELSGMSLGLLYLHEALWRALVYENPDVNYPKVWDVLRRLQDLTNRLGNQLRNNFYLVVPLKYENHDWVSIGLPVEFQKGWAGVYPFQWFFSRGFNAILPGVDFTISPDLRIDLYRFIITLGFLPWILQEDLSVFSIFDQFSEKFSPYALALNSLTQLISPYELAVGSIQMLGTQMYYSGRHWNIPIPCLPNVIPIEFKEKDVERFNYAMLLHVFQLGMASPYPEGEVNDIKREMARLVKGVLNNGEKTKLNIPNIIRNPFMYAISLLTGIQLPIPDLYCDVCNCEPEGTIGSLNLMDPYDIYSAAVAVAYNLPSVYSDPGKWQAYWNAINYTLGSGPFLIHGVFPSLFWGPSSLPVGERTCNPTAKEENKKHSELCGVNVINHNPSNTWGSAFCWEHFDDPVCRQGGGDNWEYLLPDYLIAAKYQLPPRGIDSMLEGAGLDYLLPWSLYLASTNLDPWYRDFMKQVLYDYEGLYLQACTTNPVSLALADQGQSNAWFFSKCSSTHPDTEKPITTSTISGTTGKNGWYVSHVAISIASYDCGSGVKEIRYSIDGGAESVVTGTSATISLKTDGRHKLTYYAIDKSDNIGGSHTELVNIDTTPPTTTAAVSPLPDVGGWNNSNVTVTLSATDNEGGSGVKEITYAASGAQSIPSTRVAGSLASLTISTEGKTTVVFFAEDNAGNIEQAKTVVLNLDKTPPSITVPPPVTASTGAGATMCGAVVSDATLGNASAIDNFSGVVSTSRSRVPGGNVFNVFPVGRTTISYKATDSHGNTATATQSVTVIDNTPPTITNATASPKVLRPPNHLMVPVRVTATASDNCGPGTTCKIVGIKSNEPIDSGGSYAITGNLTAKLRAWRLETGTGRIYTITVQCTDIHGNSATRDVMVTVPHNMR